MNKDEIIFKIEVFGGPVIMVITACLMEIKLVLTDYLKYDIGILDMPLNILLIIMLIIGFVMTVRIVFSLGDFGIKERDI